MTKLNIALIDDHELVRDGIKALLANEPALEVIGEGNNGEEALELLDRLEIDLLILDIRMPVMNGLEVVRILNDRPSRPKILMLSMHDSENYVRDAVSFGADGYLLKGASKSEFLKAIEVIADGKKYFAGELSSIILQNLSQNTIPNINKENARESVQEKFNLTNREHQILKLILTGLTNKEIGEKLKISKRTTEVHRFNLMRKMEVNNLAELTQCVKTLEV